jgi:hypothetical protein
MRKLLFLFSIFALVAAASAQQVITGSMTLQFGGYWDGERYVDLRGTKIPFVAEYIGPIRPDGKVIPARGVRPGHRFGDTGIRMLGGEDAPEIYRNDNGTYFTSNTEFPIPSALDDTRVAASGVNQSWKTLTVGISSTTTSTFLIRWKVYFQFSPGLGAGVQAFLPHPPAPNRDFGGYFSVPVPGNYLVTFNIASVGCNTPQAQSYFVQQFRWPQIPEQGEGPFAEGFVQTVFSGGFPTIGHSEDLFYYDWDPIDGIYDETEIDNFGGQPNEAANFALVVTAGGQQDTVLPTSFTIMTGIQQSGNLGSLWFSDDNRLIIREAPPIALGLPSVRVMIEGGVSPGQVAGFEFQMEARVPTVGNNVPQVIELFNYNSNQWVVWDTRQATTSDSIVQIVIPNNPTHYISSSNQMRARLSWYDPGNLIIPGWTAQIDHVIWKINRP